MILRSKDAPIPSRSGDLGAVKRYLTAWRVPIVVVMALSYAVPMVVGEQLPQRVPTFNDFFQLEELHEIVVSQDGKFIAFGVDRAMTSAGRPPRSYIPPTSINGTVHNYEDIWVASVDGSRVKKITDGGRDDSGFWAPQWSPDGERLAFRSTRGGRIAYWIWTRTSGKMEFLCISDIRLEPPMLTWVSNHDVVLVGDIERVPRKPSRDGLDHGEIRGPERTSPITTIDSGVPGTNIALPRAKLLRINVLTHQRTLLTDAQGLMHPTVSPDLRSAAFQQEAAAQPVTSSERPLTATTTDVNGVAFDVGMADIWNPGRVRKLRGIDGLSGKISISWSPDSTRLLITSQIGWRNQHLYICTLDDIPCERVKSTDPQLAASPSLYWADREGHCNYVWYSAHKLLLQATKDDALTPYPQLGGTWWTVDDAGNVQNLFDRRSLDNVIPVNDDSGFIGVANEMLWRFDIQGHALNGFAFPESFAIRGMDSHSLPNHTTPNNSPNVIVLQAFSPDANTDLFEATLSSGEIKPLKRPTPGAQLVAYDGQTGLQVFVDSSAATQIWVKKRSSPPGFRRIFETNLFATKLEPFRNRTIQYRTLDGEEAKSQVLLPPQFQEGKRYPVVVDVYPGTSPIDEDVVPIRRPDLDNMQLLAAHGFVVLKPNMQHFAFHVDQTEEELVDRARDPYTQLRKGVLPAVDKLIAVGIADPSRIGILGASFGGYAVFGLVTQSDRFKAAISIDGMSDLVSHYDTFHPEYDHSFWGNYTFFMLYDEIVMGFSKPPWKDMEQYIRNSPIAYVDRVTTPVMIVEGDVDQNVPSEQGTEFFMALRRQGKRAELVRYAGEAHGIYWTVNIRDFWQRAYAWFDHFLADSPNSVN